MSPPCSAFAVTFDPVRSTGESRYVVPPRDLVAGVLVLAIPTGASVWASAIESQPDWWPGVPWWSLKAALSLIWIVAAALIVRDGLIRDRRIDTLSEESRTKRNLIRTQASDAAFAGMLDPQHAFPRKWDFTIYVFDEEQSLLVPSWPPPDSDDHRQLKSFAPGKGATGRAWEREAMIVRTGDDVSGATYGLSEAQQQHYAGKHSVVATPIFTYADRKLGVLSAICEDEDDHFDKPNNQAHFKETATSIGALIVSLGVMD